MHEIQKNVPPPADVSKGGRPPAYPFVSMVDGDCFDTPIREGETEADAIKRMRTSSSSYRGRHNAPYTFVVRVAIDDQGDTVIRVWAQASVPPVKRDPFGLGV